MKKQPLVTEGIQLNRILLAEELTGDMQASYYPHRFIQKTAAKSLCARVSSKLIPGVSLPIPVSLTVQVGRYDTDRLIPVKC